MLDETRRSAVGNGRRRGNVAHTGCARRRALADAAGRFERGELTRREFLCRAAAAGFGLASLTRPAHSRAARRLDVAQLRESAGPRSAAIASSEQRKFLEDTGRAFRGK